MAPPLSILPQRAYPPGQTQTVQYIVPVGSTYVEAQLERVNFVGHTTEATASWALELSQDGGVTWLPWGTAGTLLHESKVSRQKDGTLPPFSGFRVALSRDVENPLRKIRGTLTVTERTTTALTLVFDMEPLPTFRPPDVPHSVAYDNSISAQGANITTLTTASFTIGSGSNRAAIAGLSTRSSSVNPGTVTTMTVGGVSGTEIASTLKQLSFITTQLWSVISPAAGSQTATMTWTNSVTDATLGVVTASGVDQTTPANNGTGATGLFTDLSLAVTSTSGDLTISNDSVGSTTEVYTPNQTSRWSQSSGRQAGQTGDGTGSTTFTWTSNNQLGVWAQSGANFKQAVAGSFIPPKEFLLMGLGA